MISHFKELLLLLWTKIYLLDQWNRFVVSESSYSFALLSLLATRCNIFYTSSLVVCLVVICCSCLCGMITCCIIFDYHLFSSFLLISTHHMNCLSFYKSHQSLWTTWSLQLYYFSVCFCILSSRFLFVHIFSWINSMKQVLTMSKPIQFDFSKLYFFSI